MKNFFDFLKCLPFKNVLALPLIGGLMYVMISVPSLHDSCIVLLTLVVKYFYDSSTGSAAKDATISKALDQAQNTPAIPVTNPTNTNTP